MGWTGRAPAPDGIHSAPRACQEKERRHASHVHRSRSDYYRLASINAAPSCYERRAPRGRIASRLANLSSCLIGIEAGLGFQHACDWQARRRSTEASPADASRLIGRWRQCQYRVEDALLSGS
jgi:hypothetical protein